MTKEELVEFLRENLTLDVNVNGDYGYGGDIDQYLEVRISIGPTLLASDSVRIGQ